MIKWHLTQDTVSLQSFLPPEVALLKSLMATRRKDFLWRSGLHRWGMSLLLKVLWHDISTQWRGWAMLSRILCSLSLDLYRFIIHLIIYLFLLRRKEFIWQTWANTAVWQGNYKIYGAGKWTGRAKSHAWGQIISPEPSEGIRPHGLHRTDKN